MLDQKIKNYSIFGGKNIPSFIKDWLVKRYSDEFGNVDSKSINNFLKEHMPRMNQSMINTLNVEYFSEILHLLRDDISYSPIVNSLLDVPSHADTRDVNAVKRLTTAYLNYFVLMKHIKKEVLCENRYIK